MTVATLGTPPIHAAAITAAVSVAATNICQNPMRAYSAKVRPASAMT